MNRDRFLIGALFLAVSALVTATSLSAAPPKGKLRVEVRDVKVAEATKESVALDVTWVYVEQDNLRPNTVSIIAILIGARAKEYKATQEVAVGAVGPLPTTARVVIPNDEKIVSPRICKFSVTVTPGITDGTSNTVVAGKKELSLTVTPRS